MPAGYDVTVAGIASNIAGTATSTSTGATESLLWSSALATPTVLPPPPGYDDLQVVGMSLFGEVFGSATDVSTGRRAGMAYQT